MAIATVNGTDLFYEDEGSGDPLVLVIGFTENTAAWADVAAQLTDRFRVVRFDNRCAGQSGYVDKVSMADFAADVIGLADALGLDRFHIAGQSMGGGIAQLVALEHGNRLRSMTLVNTFARLDLVTIAAFDNIGALMAGGVDLDLIVRAIAPWMYSERALADAERIDAVVASMLATPNPQAIEGYWSQLQALRDFDVTGRLGDIRTPTLVIGGHEDRVSPMRQSELLADAIPSAQLMVLPTGHGAHHEAPTLVASAIRQFIAETGATDLGD